MFYRALVRGIATVEKFTVAQVNRIITQLDAIEADILSEKGEGIAMPLNKEQKIEQFIEQHKIGGQPYEVRNTSELHPRPGRCYEVRLARQGATDFEVLQVYAGSSIEEMTLAAALWTLADEAEKYGGHETFERWDQENNYERELGRETAEMLYESSRSAYNSLVKVLGEDLYQELLNLIVNG